MSNKLKLEVIFGAKNTLSPALKMIIGSSNAASNALKKTRNEIKALNDQQKKIDGYQKQKKAVQDQAKSMQDLQNHIKNLRQQMKANPSADLTREFDKATAKAKKLKQEYERNRIELQRMRTEMNNSGLSTNRLAEHQQRLRTRLNQANQSMREQEQRLKRMAQLQQNYQRHAGQLRTASMYGVGAVATGAGIAYSMRKPIEENKSMDIDQNKIGSLGLGKEATEEATKYAKAMKTFGTSTLDNMNLVLDGVTAFADVHHAKMVAPMLAKMKFANEAMYGNEAGAENEKKFMDMLKVIEMRNGLKSDSAFKEQANIIQQVITATGGRVQAEEWLNVIKTGGIAAKGMDNKAFYYKMEPLVQEMGGFRVGTAMMSAYQNLYQGRTTQRAMGNLDKFGLIGDPTKVKHNKTGDLSYLDIGAIKGADLFKKDQFAWMEQVLVPALNAKGITKEGDVIDAIGSIFSNRTASNLFAQMYQQRDQIHKNAKLNAGAENIDQLSDRAKGTTTGKELEAKAKLHDAYLRFGQTILPIYTKAIEMATGALATFTGWMERNPTLAKILGTGLIAIAVSLVAIGGALAIFSPLILGLLSMRLIMGTLSGTTTVFSKVFSKLPSVFGILKTAVFGVGRVFLWVGRALSMTPIGRLVTVIGLAAYFIYKNWGPIKAFFINLWNGVKNAFNTGVSFIKGIIQSIDQTFAENPILNLLVPIIGIPRLIIANWEPIKAFFSSVWTHISSIFAPIGQWFNGRMNEVKNAFSNGINILNSIINNWSPFGLFYKAFAKVLSWFGVDLPAKFTGFGSMIIDGLVKGIQAGFEKLKSLWATINGWMPDFMRKTMDIHSPSRVMAGLGGHIMSGLNIGLDRAFPNLKAKFADVVSIFKPDAELLQKIDVTPALGKIKTAPLSTSSSGSSGVIVQGDTFTINFNVAPGQDIRQIQSMIENLLDRRDREKAGRIRSNYRDQD
ncbi:phage tail tape measure protein [Acinetobacter bereziniae]|uniref:phage tail tape measure protein n=1 Tax=Acinetobacter bereziniae TaxID=106648 RepID=UPI0039C07C37